jgi:hypothetical protein
MLHLQVLGKFLLRFYETKSVFFTRNITRVHDKISLKKEV